MASPKERISTRDINASFNDSLGFQIKTIGKENSTLLMKVGIIPSLYMYNVLYSRQSTLWLLDVPESKIRSTHSNNVICQPTNSRIKGSVEDRFLNANTLAKIITSPGRYHQLGPRINFTHTYSIIVYISSKR